MSKRFLWYSQTHGLSSHNGIPGFLLLVFEALWFSRTHGWNLLELHQAPIAYTYAYDQAPIAYAYAYDQVPIAYALSKSPCMGLKTKVFHVDPIFTIRESRIVKFAKFLDCLFLLKDGEGASTPAPSGQHGGQLFQANSSSTQYL